MARNVKLQVLRGTYAQLLTLQGGTDPDTGLAASPLAWGEMYFGTDTASLYFGCPGVGLGYITIGDTTQVNEKLDQLIVIMEAARRALVSLACEGGKAKELDFDPITISEELAGTSPAGG